MMAKMLTAVMFAILLEILSEGSTTFYGSTSFNRNSTQYTIHLLLCFLKKEQLTTVPLTTLNRR